MVRNILCIGAGYVGGPTMAVIAKYCPGVQVVVADINPDRLELKNLMVAPARRRLVVPQPRP